MTASICTRDVFTRKPTFCVALGDAGTRRASYAGIRIAGGDRVGVDLRGKRLQGGQVENLDVADHVRIVQHLPDGEGGFPPLCLVVGEVLDVESGDRELVRGRARAPGPRSCWPDVAGGVSGRIL